MGFAYKFFCRREYFLIDQKGHLSGLGQHGGIDSQVTLEKMRELKKYIEILMFNCYFIYIFICR